MYLSGYIMRISASTAFAARTTFLRANTQSTDTFEAVLLETSGLPVVFLLALWVFLLALVPLINDFFLTLMVFSSIGICESGNLDQGILSTSLAIRALVQVPCQNP